ncbi:hypothetical protein DFS33DRAFT_1034388 [Desarmillaria ectypa]|nr:hypothetical protein DFS33DRAFT_1034388 [Desarmillaria ectypa]
MKIVKRQENPSELSIRTFLINKEKPSGRRNHCLPILRTLSISDKGHSIIVMPYLQEWYDPKFKTIGKGVQSFKEMLEGLQFIHGHRVPHHDGGFTNIMMDATQMHGLGSLHPHEKDRKYDFPDRA